MEGELVVMHKAYTSHARGQIIFMDGSHILVGSV